MASSSVRVTPPAEEVTATCARARADQLAKSRATSSSLKIRIMKREFRGGKWEQGGHARADPRQKKRLHEPANAGRQSLGEERRSVSEKAPLQDRLGK